MVISVTHRLHNIQHYDEIFVFDEGVLVKHGSHVDLLERKGRYHRLYEKQSGVHLSETGHRVDVDPNWLGTLPVFEELSEQLLAEVAGSLVTKRFEADEVVVSEGEAGHEVYVVAHG